MLESFCKAKAWVIHRSIYPEHESWPVNPRAIIFATMLEQDHLDAHAHLRFGRVALVDQFAWQVVRVHPPGGWMAPG